jgi:MFS superfamily sulfate permease-like transporter
MDQNPPKSADLLDGAAVTLSALCLVHCLALPLLVAGLPFLSQFSEGHLHAQVLVVVIPLSTVALLIGYRRHRDIRIVLAGVLGMALLVIGATVAHQRLGLTADRLFTITGSLVLGTAHLFNSYRRKPVKSSV